MPEYDYLESICLGETPLEEDEVTEMLLSQFQRLLSADGVRTSLRPAQEFKDDMILATDPWNHKRAASCPRGRATSREFHSRSSPTRIVLTVNSQDVV